MRWTQKQYDDYLARQKARTPILPMAPLEPDRSLVERPYVGNALPCPCVGWNGKQTKTEIKYNREILGGKGRFEAVTLVLPGGGRYTPDFMTIDGGVVTFHEIKGSYRLGSQGRALTAFQEACAAFPFWRFVWSQWTGKEWKRKTYEPMEGEA